MPVNITPYEDCPFKASFEITGGRDPYFSKQYGWQPAEAPDVDWIGFTDEDDNPVEDSQVPKLIQDYCHVHHTRLQREAYIWVS